MTKQIRVLLLLLSFLALLSFYFFSREVKRGFLKQADFNTTVRLQDHLPARLDGMWEDAAFFVTPVSSIVIVGLLTIAALIDRKKKKIRLRALVIPLLFGALILGEIYGKSVVHHPAPPFFMIKSPTTIFPKYYINEQYSYPSGHTARAMFLGLVSLSLISYRLSLSRKNLKKWLAIGALVTLYIVTVAISRIYLGHHWLSDIIGGGLLGAGLGLLTAGFISPIMDQQ